MAGTDPDFDAAEARAEFRAVMTMGMPTAVADQLKWRWRRTKGYVPDDPAGNPYDWTTAPVVDVAGNPADTDGDDTVIVPYALEVLGTGDDAATSVGVLDFTRARVTLLDEDYAKVADADYCTCGRRTYTIDFGPPAVGLFDLTVHTVLLEARS